MEHGNYKVNVPVRGRDELGRLAVAFNDMAGQVQTSHIAQEQRIAEHTQELAERKKAEDDLRDSETRYRRLFEGNWPGPE